MGMDEWKGVCSVRTHVGLACYLTSGKSATIHSIHVIHKEPDFCLRVRVILSDSICSLFRACCLNNSGGWGQDFLGDGLLFRHFCQLGLFYLC